MYQRLRTLVRPVQAPLSYTTTAVEDRQKRNLVLGSEDPGAQRNDVGVVQLNFVSLLHEREDIGIIILCSSDLGRWFVGDHCHWSLGRYRCGWLHTSAYGGGSELRQFRRRVESQINGFRLANGGRRNRDLERTHREQSGPNQWIKHTDTF